MKIHIQRGLLYTWVLVLLVSLSGCELVGDIFEAGAWTGIILVVGIVVLALWLFSRFFRGGPRV